MILPVALPPLQDGAVLIGRNRILRVESGDWKSSRSATRVVDLGDSILMPGLVNAHCHLDYTDMAGMLPPQKAFTDWIKLMLAAKAEWNYSEFAASWLRGAEMLRRTGTTTVADFETVPELLPHVWSATPLRVISLIEMTGVRHRRDPFTILRDAVQQIERLPGGRCSPGLAPHAPYSTPPHLARLSAAVAQARGWPFSIHLSESREEFEMFACGRGEMYDWLRRNQRDMSDCGLGSPVQHLDRNGVLNRSTLAVHVNYLAKHDAALLGAQETCVVHCPRSHAYFRHDPFPFSVLTRNNVNVCLGTDSLASVCSDRRRPVELNLFDEMRTFAAANPRVSARRIVQMATLNGARALGLRGSAGEITRGALADLIVIPFAGKIADAYDAVIAHRGPVTASMMDGEWAIPPESAGKRGS